MSIIGVSEELFVDTSTNDLAGAIAAGVCAGLVRSLINALYHDLSIWACVRWIVLAVTAYFIVAAVLRRFSRERIVPNWILTAFLGSMLFVAAVLAPGVINGWYDPYGVHQSFKDYLVPELTAAKSVVIMLTFVGLLVTGIFHYAREIIRAIKEWHAGAGPSRILR